MTGSNLSAESIIRPVCPLYTGVGEIAGEPRVSALPSEIEAVQAFSYEDRTVIAAAPGHLGAAKPIPKT
jgi:hypothetical protein